MELRQLRQFVAVARTLSFRRAAVQLNVAQPPLSVSIAKLEDELQVKLFERHHDGVRLTEAGEMALPFAQSALARIDDLKNALGAAAEGKAGQLRVGFVPTATYTLVPRLTSAFQKEHPAVEVILEEAKANECLERVAIGSLDLAIVRTPLAESTGLALTPLERGELILVVPPGHRLLGRKEVSLESLRDEPFILYDRSAPGMRSLVLMSCQTAGFMPRVAHTAAQTHSLLALVRAGLGVSIIPGIDGLDAYEQERIMPITLHGQRIEVGLSLAQRRNEVGSLVLNFVAMAQRVAPLYADRPAGGDTYQISPSSEIVLDRLSPTC